MFKEILYVSRLMLQYTDKKRFLLKSFGLFDDQSCFDFHRN